MYPATYSKHSQKPCIIHSHQPSPVLLEAFVHSHHYLFALKRWSFQHPNMTFYESPALLVNKVSNWTTTSSGSTCYCHHLGIVSLSHRPRKLIGTMTATNLKQTKALGNLKQLRYFWHLLTGYIDQDGYVWSHNRHLQYIQRYDSG